MVPITRQVGGWVKCVNYAIEYDATVTVRDYVMILETLLTEKRDMQYNYCKFEHMYTKTTIHILIDLFKWKYIHFEYVWKEKQVIKPI